MKNNKGVTLIALVVTIIIMLILAGVSISSVLNNSTIDKAREVSFKSEAQDIKDAWETKIIGIDSTYLEYSDLTSLLGGSNASDDMLKKLEIQNGELVYKNDKCTDEEKEWFESLGIYGGVSFVASVKTKINIVGSDIENQTREQAMDVILVLDVSGSMEDIDDGVKRSEKMTNVINTTVEQIMELNEKNRVGIVTFSSESSEFIPLDHYTSISEDGRFFEYANKSIATYKTERKKKIHLMQNSKGTNVEKSIAITGGTYTQSGMSLAYQKINSRADKENLPAIILITDGLPTYYSTFDIGSISGNLGRRTGSGRDTDEKHGINNIITSTWIKNQIPNIRLYNIAIADFNGADKEFIDLTLNPNEITLENAKNCNTTGDNIGNADTVRTLATNLEREMNNHRNVDYFYANGYEVGAMSESELKSWFKNVIEDIANNLDQGGLIIGDNNNITGVYEVDADNLTYTTTLGPDGKTEDGSDIEGTYYFRLAEDNKININVTAAAFEKSTSEEEAKMIEGTEYTTPSQKFSIQNIKDGIEPNLFFLDGQIKWNVRSEYKNKSGLAKKAIEGVSLPNENCEAEVIEVLIELPVITTDFVPKDE